MNRILAAILIAALCIAVNIFLFPNEFVDIAPFPNDEQRERKQRNLANAYAESFDCVRDVINGSLYGTKYEKLFNAYEETINESTKKALDCAELTNIHDQLICFSDAAVYVIDIIGELDEMLTMDDDDIRSVDFIMLYHSKCTLDTLFNSNRDLLKHDMLIAIQRIRSAINCTQFVYEISLNGTEFEPLLDKYEVLFEQTIDRLNKCGRLDEEDHQLRCLVYELRSFKRLFVGLMESIEADQHLTQQLTSQTINCGFLDILRYHSIFACNNVEPQIRAYNHTRWQIKIFAHIKCVKFATSNDFQHQPFVTEFEQIRDSFKLCQDLKSFEDIQMCVNDGLLLYTKFMRNVTKSMGDQIDSTTKQSVQEMLLNCNVRAQILTEITLILFYSSALPFSSKKFIESAECITSAIVNSLEYETIFAEYIILLDSSLEVLSKCKHLENRNGAQKCVYEAEFDYALFDLLMEPMLDNERIRRMRKLIKMC